MKIHDLPLRAVLPAAMLMALPLDAHAYLDPGTGSAIIQGIIAGASALLVTGHLYWARLTGWLRSKSRAGAVEPEQAGTANTDEAATKDRSVDP